MKKGIILFSLIIAVLCVMGVTIYKYAYVFADFPKSLSQYSSIENLYCFVTDSQNNVYMIDQSRQRIMKTDTLGEITYIIPKDTREGGQVSPFTDIAVDDSGFLYVLTTVPFNGGYNVRSEKITRYTPDGKYDGIVYRIDYNNIADSPVRPGRIRSLKIKDRFLYFYFVDEKNIQLQRIALNDKRRKISDSETTLNITFPEETYIAKIIGIEKDEIYYTTKNAQIYKIDSTGTPVKVYSANNLNTYPMSIPLNIYVTPEKQVYFADVGRNEIICLSSEKTSMVGTQAVSFKDLSEQWEKNESRMISDFKVTKDGSIMISTASRILCVSLSSSKVIFNLSQVTYPLKSIVFNLSILLIPLLMLCLLIYAIKIFYIDILKRRTYMVFKQIIIFIPIIVGSLVLISSIIYTDFLSSYEKQIDNKLNLLAHMGPKTIDIKTLEKVTKPEHYMNDDYKYVRNQVHSLFDEVLQRSDKNEKDNTVLYNAIFRCEGDKMYVWQYYDNGSCTGYPVQYGESSVYYQLIKNNKDYGITDTPDADTDGLWEYACERIYNSEGKFIGIWETGTDLNGLEAYKRLLFFKIVRVSTIVTIVIILAFFAATFYLLTPIRVLQKGVNEMANDNLDVSLNVNTMDEGRDLCDGFIKMREFIKIKMEQIEEMSKSYSRFVPVELKKYLGKEEITDVILGDQVEKEITIMFSNIREFSTLSQRMSPEKCFDYINSFLKRIGPVIPTERGFIDKYLGAGIRALFAEEPEDALKGAIKIRAELESYNKECRAQGLEPVDIGIGIHKGNIRLGVVGEESRLEGTVISNSVSFTEELERLTVKVGAYILISGEILEAISSPERYQYRFLGLVGIRGMEEPAMLYDVFEGDPEHLKKLKRDTKVDFEEGIKLYNEKRFDEARKKFIDVIKQNREDEAAKIYFFLCDKYVHEGIPNGWEGILDLRQVGDGS